MTKAKKKKKTGFFRGGITVDTCAMLLKYAAMTEKSLKKYMQKTGYPAVIFESMKYSLYAGGKRLRPVLALLTAEASGKNPMFAMPLACGIEMIHTYSLIHDDLPAMDDDTIRRGKPTNHVKYGEANAILAGDGLLTRAFEVMLLNAKKRGAAPEAVIEACLIVAKAAGAEGMVGGQAADILNEGKEFDKKILSYIHSHKTGALITASVESSAALCGVKPAIRSAFRDFGQKIGLAFQITDDILDITADGKSLGKTKGKDLAAKKATYPSMYGLEASAETAEKLIIEAKKALCRIDGNTNKLAAVADYFTARAY